MTATQHLQAAGLSPVTANAFYAIHAGRRQIESARRAGDGRLERAARRSIEAAKKSARDAGDSWKICR